MCRYSADVPDPACIQEYTAKYNNNKGDDNKDNNDNNNDDNNNNNNNNDDNNNNNNGDDNNKSPTSDDEETATGQGAAVTAQQSTGAASTSSLGAPGAYLEDPNAWIEEMRARADAIAGPRVRDAVNDMYAPVFGGSSFTPTPSSSSASAEDLMNEAANGREGGVFNMLRRDGERPNRRW